MRRFFLLLFPLFVSSILFAADPVAITVLDPQSRPVSGARVSIYEEKNDAAVAILSTDAFGAARLTGVAPGQYQLEVLAPGFAAHDATVDIPLVKTLEIHLRLATASETVNVTATQSELAAALSGAPAYVLVRSTLELMQPTSVNEALRFMPGAVVNNAGRRGSLSSLFVRGGESRHNKVIIDGVPVNDVGGTFDFGVVPTYELERIEFVRGAESTLYGSDAMTSVVQLFTATGKTRVPEFRFGAEGGTFSTARGYASLAGARGRFDYMVFGDQTHTEGQGVNDDFSNSSQGGNLGAAVAKNVDFRLRLRHSNSRSGVQTFWNFNGQPLLPPDIDQFARQNNFLASAELTVRAPGNWVHRFTGIEYNHRRLNQDALADRTCAFPQFLDCDFVDLFNANRAGFEYRGEYAPRSWFRTTMGYSFEDENGFVNQDFSGFVINSHGLRRNHAVYGQGIFTRNRVSLVSGLRYVNNESFGSKVVPRVAATVLAWRGKGPLTGTRLRFAYSQGIKEPRLEESFGAVGAFGPVTLPNPNLKAEENRSLETGIIQNFGSRASFTASYFNNEFTNQIAFSFDPVTFTSQYVNLNRALAHGAEVELHLRPTRRVALNAAYLYTATQILEAPLAFSSFLQKGAPLLRRPKHSGSVQLNYLSGRWGANLGGSFVGNRPDSDFGVLATPVTQASGYARFDLGAWYAVNRYVTAYANMENLLNRKYEEVAGYPALKANFRAGLRFRIGGD